MHVARRIDHTKLHVLAVTVTLSQRHHHNRRHAYCIVQVSQCSRMSADSLSHCLLTSWRAPLTTSVSRACHERVTGSSTGATPRPHCTLPGTRDTCAALAATDDACWCVDNHCCVNNFARLFCSRTDALYVCVSGKEGVVGVQGLVDRMVLVIMRKSLESYRIGKQIFSVLAAKGVTVKMSSNIVPDLILPKSRTRGSIGAFVVSSERQMSAALIERHVQALKTFNHTVCIVGSGVVAKYFQFCFGFEHCPRKLHYELIPQRQVERFVTNLATKSAPIVKESEDLNQKQKSTDKEIEQLTRVYLQTRLRAPVSRSCAQQLLKCHGSIKSIAHIEDNDLRSFVTASSLNEASLSKF